MFVHFKDYVACPLGCGQSKILHREMEAHFKEVCSAIETQCNRCDTVVTRGQQSDHDCTRENANKIDRKTAEVSDEVKTLRDKIEEQKVAHAAEIESLKRKNDELKKQAEASSHTHAAEIENLKRKTDEALKNQAEASSQQMLELKSELNSMKEKLKGVHDALLAPIDLAFMKIKAQANKQVEVITSNNYNVDYHKNRVTDFINKSDSISALKENGLSAIVKVNPNYNCTFSVSLDKDEHKATGFAYYKAKVGDLYIT